MTTKLLEALDGACGWNLTPPQRQAIFDLESKVVALEMGYQLHNKQMAIQTQAIKRQRAMICQLLEMINQLKSANTQTQQTLFSTQVFVREMDELRNELAESVDEQFQSTKKCIDALESKYKGISTDELKQQCQKYLDSLQPKSAPEVKRTQKTPTKKTT